jgi:hypothetical protein
MNDLVESTEHTLPDGRKVTVNVYYDDDRDSPNDWGGNGTFHVFEHGSAFWKAAEETFGNKAKRVVNDLVQGVDVKHKGKTYVGLERYRHSGDAYARCGKGHFPDRQWDVSPIVGWWESNADSPVEQFDSCLKTWNQYVQGYVYGIVIEDENGEQLDSLWGIYGMDSVDSYVDEMLDGVAQ